MGRRGKLDIMYVCHVEIKMAFGSDVTAGRSGKQDLTGSVVQNGVSREGSGEQDHSYLVHRVQGLHK